MIRDFVIIGVAIIGVAVTVYVEHRSLWARWHRYEFARRAIGVCTVFGWMFGAALLGALDVTTVVVTFGAFGIAGSVYGLSLTAERAAVNQNARGELGGEGTQNNGETRGSGTVLP